MQFGPGRKLGSMEHPRWNAGSEHEIDGKVLALVTNKRLTKESIFRIQPLEKSGVRISAGFVACHHTRVEGDLPVADVSGQCQDIDSLTRGGLQVRACLFGPVL